MLINRTLCQSWLTHVTHILNGNRAARHSLFTQYIGQPVRHFHAHKPRLSNIKSSVVGPAAGGERIQSSTVLKAIAFTGAFTIGCFAGATIIEYENTRRLIISKAKQARFGWLSNRTFGERDTWSQIKNDVRRFWDSLLPADKIFAPILVCNLIVFALWRFPAMRPIMETYFTSNPAARVVCWPMFLSTFSHYSVMHIFTNMYVLYSFSLPAVVSMGKEQFVAAYLSAGVFSSLVSILYKAGTRQSGRSVGASGAIMMVLAYVSTKYPDTELGMLFLPFVTFPAGAAIKVLMGIDFAGCVMGWKIFDHAAHLGGAMFGIFWAHYGAQVWAKRIGLLNYYHEFRSTKQK